jgi:hypothetical protein
MMTLQEFALALQALLEQVLAANAVATGDDVVEGVRISEYFAAPDRVKRWPGLGEKIMRLQYQKLSLPHEYVQWAQGVTPDQAGDNTNWISKYDEWRGFYQNAEQAGVMFHVVDYIAKYGEAKFKADLYAAWSGPFGQSWLSDDRTVNLRPKDPPPAP